MVPKGSSECRFPAMVLINSNHLNLDFNHDDHHMNLLIDNNSNVDLNQDTNEDSNNSTDDHEPNGRKGPWSPEEDSCLKSFVKRNGVGKWGLIANDLDRTSKSCRLRWCNQLSLHIYHGLFTEDEDAIIVRMYEERGSKWSQIAKVLKCRTDNQVKNRWNSNLSKQLQVHGRRPHHKDPKGKSAKGLRANYHPTPWNSKAGSRPTRFNSTTTPNSAAPFADQVTPAAASVELSESPRHFPAYRNAAPPAPAAYHNSNLFACVAPHRRLDFVDAYLPPAFVTPAAPFVNQIYPPAAPSYNGNPSPAPAFNHLTSLSLFPPGHETDDVKYLHQLPNRPAALENWTDLMEEVIGVDLEQENGASRHAGFNLAK